MAQTVILALGYLTFPLIVTKTTKVIDEFKDEKTTATTPRWSFGNTISIVSFLKDPPTQYPTMEKHVLKLAIDAYSHDRELSSLLSKALTTVSSDMNKNSNKPVCALILLATDSWGILSVTEEPTIYTLQVIQPPTSQAQSLLSSRNTTVDTNALLQEGVSSNDGLSSKSVVLEEDQLVKPAEIMRLCQQWPQSQPQLVALAEQVYGIASLYGYWDYWRLFEGICNNYKITGLFPPLNGSS